VNTTDVNEVLIKATPLRSARAFIEGSISKEAMERVLSKTIADFPDQQERLRRHTIVASERVPVRMINRMIELAAEELKEPAPQLAHRIGRRGAEDAAGTILRLAMVMVSMPALLRKLSPVWTQLYSHGTMTSSVEGKEGLIELKGFPLVSATGCGRVTGFLEWFAEKGDRRATIRHTACTSKGAPSCQWELRW
jgi:hypothetical protein